MRRKKLSHRFDYENQNAYLHRQRCSGKSSMQKGRMDLDYLANMVAWLAHNCQGGSLVLFTSHTDLKETIIVMRFLKIKRPLTLKVLNSRSQLRQQLVSSGNATLLGADSFWTEDIIDLRRKSSSHDFPLKPKSSDQRSSQ